jgi:hypothetical protein
MANILKKYSRAAGDRSQWKKVEAMFEQNSERAPRAPKASFGGGGRSRAPISPLLCFKYTKQSLGTDHNANTDYVIGMIVD